MPQPLPRSSLVSRFASSSLRLSSHHPRGITIISGSASSIANRNYNCTTSIPHCRCGCRNTTNSVCSCTCCAHPTPQKRTFVSVSSASAVSQPARIKSIFSGSATLPYSRKLTHPHRTLSSTPPTMAQEYKLKDIKSLADVKDFDKVESELEGLEGGKVLVVKVSGKPYALSPKCTHYGAPLKNGVLTPDGRLTCPWHGGEFCLLFLSCC